MSERITVVLLRWLRVLLGMMWGACLAHADTLYSVGNSLTNDMYPDGVQPLSQAMGANLNVGYHIRSSASLTYMTANPADVTLTRPAPWIDALSRNSYDYIALQPYRGLGNPTVATEFAAFAQIVEAALAGASRQAVFCIYEAWPNQDDTEGNYHAYWTQGVSGDVSLPPLQARAYYDRLLAELQARFGSRATFRVIPVGDVFDRIDQDARAGLIPGVSNMRALYRDQIHMGEVGRFVAAATVLSTIYKRRADVDAALDIYQFNDGAAELTRESAKSMLDIVWSVVAADSRTGATPKSEVPVNYMMPSSGGGGAVELWLLLSATTLLVLRIAGKAPSRNN